MLRSKVLATALLGAAFAAAPSFAQEYYHSEVSVQAFGSFVKDTNQNNVRQNATDSGGVLANYRYFFSNNHGVEVNYGYSRNTQGYALPAGPVGVNANQNEVTAAYVYRRPMHKITPFVEAGVGALVFDPRNLAGASAQTRAAFVYGGGADLDVTRHVFVRAEYRGFVYNSPTFDLVSLVDNDRTTHRAEPSVGFGYRF